MAKFRIKNIEKRIRGLFPGCPEFAVVHIARLVADRHWWDMTPYAAIALTVESVLRHNMTEYEQLLRNGADREEARLAVRWKIDTMLELWRIPKSDNKSNPVAGDLEK